MTTREQREGPRRPDLAAALRVELDERARELTEAHRREAATAEVLKIISCSTFDLQTVLDGLIESAVRLTGAEVGLVLRQDGEVYRPAAFYGASPEFIEIATQSPIAPGRGSATGRAILEGRLVHIHDVLADPENTWAGREAAEARTIVAVPMIRQSGVIGVIVLRRARVQPFTDQQISLLETFAAQAVIAMENVRLFKELRESLQRQTATADVLKVISRSAFDLQTVLDTLVEWAAKLCDADSGIIRRHEGDAYPLAATYGLSRGQREHFASYSTKPDRKTVFGRSVVEGRAVHVPDVLADPEYEGPLLHGFVRMRALLGVPLVREGIIVGVFTLLRREPRPYSEKQIELVQTFAAQAVIAIENARLLNELRQRTDDLTESLEQQTATSEVLRVISSSPGDLEPVFNAMLENGVRICGAKIGVLMLAEGDAYRIVAQHGALPAYAEYRRREPLVKPSPGGNLARVAATKQAAQIEDLRVSAADPNLHGIIHLADARTMLNVPMLKDNELVGQIAFYRREVRPFTDKQVDLLQNFAAQAVIAIENARLLSELRQRTDDLTESLEQQTATSEVLKVISSLPSDLEPVLETLLAKATQLCEAKHGSLMLSEGDAFRIVAMHDAPPALVELRKRDPSKLLIRAGPAGALGRIVKTKDVVQIADLTADQAYLDRMPARVAIVEVAGYRSLLSVPMLKDDVLIGVINILRQEVGPFADKQVALVKDFAAQAVIAIENARLLNELRQRTNDLSESLEQQTAASEVLKVISSSPGDLEPVFTSMLENAVRICGAKFGVLMLAEGDAYRIVALHGAPPAYAEYRRREPLVKPSPGGNLARVAATKQAAQIEDLRVSAADDPNRRAIIDLADARTMVNVPMLKDNELVGQIVIYRQEVRPFTDKQIDLLKNFAAQAVIAIENARLLTELRQRTDDLSEALEHQTATSEVLKVISSSRGDLAPVFNALLDNAARICDAKFGTLFWYDGEVFHVDAMLGAPPAFEALLRTGPRRPTPLSALWRLVAERRAVHIADVLTERAYFENDPRRRELVDLGGARTFLAVPMLRNAELVGALAIYRQEVRPFSDKQIELVENFAAQAVIAIENARLLNEVREQAGQLEAQSQELRTLNQQLEGRVDEQVGEIERMGRLRRFLSPQVADLIVSSGGEKQLEESSPRNLGLIL